MIIEDILPCRMDLSKRFFNNKYKSKKEYRSSINFWNINDKLIEYIIEYIYFIYYRIYIFYNVEENSLKVVSTTSTNQRMNFRFQSTTGYTCLIRFLPGSCHINAAVWMRYMDANKTAREEARWQLYKNAASNMEQVLAEASHKAPTIRPRASHHENYPS